MSAVQLKRAQCDAGSLILVNPKHPLKSSELFLENLDNTAIRLEVRTCIMLKKALEECGMSNEVSAVSGWRSHAEQETLFADSLIQNGEAYTRQFVALPGCSEHESGLAIDLAERKPEIDFICPSLPYDGRFALLRKTLVRYGFIERYLKGKESTTQISAEPWHFRYVGFPHSAIIQEKGLVLEEYIELLKTTSRQNPLSYTQNGTDFEIWREEFHEAEMTLQIPDRKLYQISGDNCGGVIITCWRSLC